MDSLDEEEKRSRLIKCGVVTTVLIIISIMLSAMWDVVDYDQVGLLVDEFSYKVLKSAEGTPIIKSTGHHFTGLGRAFVKFNKTYHNIDMIYEGEDGKQADGVGSAASNPFGGPITIRTIDGQMIDMEVSLQYKLKVEKIYEIYIMFGMKYDEFITSIVRAKSRDEAAKHKANAFFENRIMIEKSLRGSLEAAINEVHCDMVGFQLLNVYLPAQLEQTIKNIQEKRLKVDLKNVQLLTTEIKANTTLAVKEVNAETSKQLAEYAAGTRNKVLLLKQERDIYKEQTETVKETATNNYDLLINIEDAKIAIIDANYTGEIMKIEAVTAKKLANITNAAEVAKAKVEKIIANTNSVADAKAYKAKHNATAIAMKKTAAAYGTAYTKVKTKGFLASDINHLEWAEFFSKHPSSKIHMDLSQPSKLYLDPTQASNHDANMQSNSNDL